MINVKPFRGLFYNRSKVSDLGEVVSPPYDVISEEEYHSYCEKHPNNVVRLDGFLSFGDDTTAAKYAAAASTFEQWRESGVLVREEKPALYVTTVEFEHEGERIVRHGVICLMELEPYDQGGVLPHEKTYSLTKEDRFELIKACKANFSQIFSIFDDQDNVNGDLMKITKDSPPDTVLTDEAGSVHKMWRITDPGFQQSFAQAVAYRTMVIADGHHRYESALRYRQWAAENDPNYDHDHPANYVMTYMCSSKDPGLLILPTHRTLKTVDETRMKKVMDKAREFFYVTPITWKAEGFDRAREEFLQTLTINDSECAIGVLVKGRSEFYILTLKPNILKLKFKKEIPAPLRELDAYVLTRLVFMELLGLDRSDLNDEGMISYSTDADEGIDLVFSGEADMAFILNPPSNSDVFDVAQSGLTMPRKSTFYYPKVLTGQVMNWLETEG